MNKRFLFLGLLVYACFMTAALARNRTLALLAVPIIVYLLIGVLRAPGAMNLTARRSISKYSVASSAPVEVQVTLENQGSSILNLSFGDRLQESMQIIAGHPSQQVSLPAGGSVDLSYTFTAERGCYSWKSLEVVSSDPFGLFEVVQAIPAPGEVLVLPVWQRLRHVPIRPRYTLHSAGPIPARKGGSGTDFWGVRQYRPGDPLRWLDWRRTARHPQQFFTKEFEQEEIADIGLILDARTLTDHPNGRDSLFEYGVSACGSLAELFMREGNRVGLMIYGDKLPSLSPGYGKIQLNRIFAELAKAAPGSNFTLDSLKNLPVRLFPSRAVLIFVSPLGEKDVQALAQLHGFGYQILLVSPDPVSFAATGAGKDGIARLAFRAARLERVMLLKQLVRMGIQVVDWQVDKPLANALQAAVRLGVGVEMRGRRAAA